MRSTANITEPYEGCELHTSETRWAYENHNRTVLLT